MSIKLPEEHIEQMKPDDLREHGTRHTETDYDMERIGR